MVDFCFCFFFRVRFFGLFVLLIWEMGKVDDG